MKNKIKLFDPYVGIEEERALIKTLKSHFWASGSGTGNVLKFEKSFQKYLRSKDCIAVNSGSSALNLALSLVNIKNKEVILPALTFVSTAHSIIVNGGKPVFADIDPNTLCLDPEKLPNMINKKTKVILPVHFGGMPCDLRTINDISKENHLEMIEDAAHAAGSSYKNQKIGSHGMVVCFSFHPVKNLAMPTGGLLSINHKNHKKIREILLSRRWCGITNRKNSKYDVKEIGWNYYMNEFSAAIGLVQLKKLDLMNKMRKKIAKKYFEKINLQNKMPFENDCSYHLYWICVQNRKQFRKKMKSIGIETGIHYRPINSMLMYKNKSKLETTDKISKQIVSIPIHPNLSTNNIEKIISSVNKFC